MAPEERTYICAICVICGYMQAEAVTMQTLNHQLAAIVGPAHLSEDGAPFAVHGRAPLLVAAPASVEELAQVVAACHSARVPVIPYGGGTMQSWGRPLVAERFVAVRTTRLDKILIYEPDDLTISVQAGMPFATLDAALAANGQMLPLDPPWPARSTIGGLLATGMDGPRRLGYGSARDLVIGIQMVEATGRVSKAGGMVVKNVSGFDMMKLYLGSLGTLGIIVSANFKLMPRPRAAASLSCRFARPEGAFALADALRQGQLTPAAVEYHEGQSALADSPGAASMFTLEVRVEGLAAAVERHLRDVTALAERHGAAEVATLPNGSPEVGPLWALHNNLPQTLERDDNELVLRLSCLPAELPVALVDARALAARNGLQLRLNARALNGVAYLRLRGVELAAWHAAMLERWPHLTLLAAPVGLAAELPAWGREPANLALMRRIKQEFDPDNLLNPGRFVV